MLYKRLNRKKSRSNGTTCASRLFFLMSVLPETLFTLVRSHFVLLSFLSARHINVLIFISLSRGWFEFYFKSCRYESMVA